MNWFERYGIVGMFFIIMTGVWVFCLFPDFSTILFEQVKNDKGLASLIVGFCGLSFLPIGYLIVIFGQFLYYRTNLWEKIHCKYLEALPNEMKKALEVAEKKNNGKSLSEDDKKNEAKLEAIFTYYDRMYMKDDEKNKFLSAFATKRYDVIAINRSLLLAILVSLILAICIELVSLSVTLEELWKLFGHIHLSAWLVLVGASIVWFVLRSSSSILENQIIEIGKRKFRNIENNVKRPREKKNNAVKLSDIGK